MKYKEKYVINKKGLSIVVMITLLVGFTSCGMSSSYDDDTPLILNAVNEIGNFDICAQELDKGANPDYATVKRFFGKKEVSLIKECMDSDNIRMTEYLLKKGSNPDYKFDKKRGATLLMYASGYEDSGISVDGVICYNNVKILLDYGANINEVDNEGMSALDHSINSEGMNIGVNNVLLDNDIKISSTTIKTLNKKLIIYDEKKGVVKRLVDFFSQSYQEEEEKSIDFGDFRSAMRIYSIAHENNIDLELSAPMSEIVTNNDNRLVVNNINKLLDNELDAAMCFTACFGSVQTMKDIIKNGGDIKQSNYYTGTLLSLASQHHNNSMVKFLIDKGLMIDESSAEFVAPIDRAAESGDVSTMELLMDHGANILYGHSEGYYSEKSTLCRAAIFGNVDGINLVMNNIGQKINNLELFAACREAIDNDQIKCLKLLLQICHERDYYPDDKLVEYSVTNNKKDPYVNLEILKYLVENGADVNGKNDNIPIGTAVIQSETSSLAFLIENGAEINSSHNNDDDDINYSAPCIFDAVMIGNLDIIKILVDAGADIQFNDPDYGTPIEYAESLGNEYTVRYLMNRIDK